MVSIHCLIVWYFGTLKRCYLPDTGQRGTGMEQFQGHEKYANCHGYFSILAKSIFKRFSHIHVVSKLKFAMKVKLVHKAKTRWNLLKHDVHKVDLNRYLCYLVEENQSWGDTRIRERQRVVSSPGRREPVWNLLHSAPRSSDWNLGTVFSYKLRYIVGFGLVEMAISTNWKPTIYHNLYENIGPACPDYGCNMG